MALQAFQKPLESQKSLLGNIRDSKGPQRSFRDPLETLRLSCGSCNFQIALLGPLRLFGDPRSPLNSLGVARGS